MTITKTIWELDQHTKIKHEILKRYLNAWIPILSNKGKVNYIDGFAGPGKYSNGEDGSPLIAIKCLIEHKLINKMHSTKFNFLFIEEKKVRCDNLKIEIEKLVIPKNLNCNINIECGEFQSKVKTILDFIESENKSLAPTFVFIDPFGFSGIPFDIIKRIMKHPGCEVFINFMYEDISRFFSLGINEDHLNSLFGTNEWKPILNNKILSSDERVWKLHDLYEHQLKSIAQITFVQSFLMINKFNKPDYFLFFGSNSPLGFEKMKEAIWKVDPAGKFKFSDSEYNPNQRLLFSPIPPYKILEEKLVNHFQCKKVSMNEIERFVREETLFLPTHIRENVLTKLEKEGKIRVICNGNKRRKGTFPCNKIDIEFL